MLRDYEIQQIEEALGAYVFWLEKTTRPITKEKRFLHNTSKNIYDEIQKYKSRNELVEEYRHITRNALIICLTVIFCTILLSIIGTGNYLIVEITQNIKRFAFLFILFLLPYLYVWFVNECIRKRIIVYRFNRIADLILNDVKTYREEF